MRNKKLELKINDLTKIYSHPSKEGVFYTIFAGINCTFTSGNINFLIGPSGSGKTTFLRVLLGLEEINAGEMHLNNITLNLLKGVNKRNYMKKVGYLDQFPVRNISLQLNVRQNLEYALMLRESLSKEERKKRIHETAKDFDLQNLLNNKTLTLSGGELQKLSLASSIIFNPTVLLCDEPTSQLDEKSKDEIIGVISDFVKYSSALVIIATHDYSLIENHPTYEIKQGGLVKCQ